MADIAIDRRGRLFGVSAREGRVYAIDPASAATTMISVLDERRTYNGLSFVPVPGEVDREVLMGVTSSGHIYHIDERTGTTTELGRLGGNLRSSGDIVYVHGAGLYAAVRPSTAESEAGEASDLIAKIDRFSFAATIVGAAQQDRIWGLGYWRGQLIGFTSNGSGIEDGGSLLTIDTSSGLATEAAPDAVSPWWGAAVATDAPVR